METFEGWRHSIDPAAYDALQILARRQDGNRRRAEAAIQVVRQVLALAGFRPAAPLELLDIESGRVYRE